MATGVSMDDSITRALREYLVANYLPHTGKATLDNDQDLFDTGVLDSASALAVLFHVEETFGISVPDEDFLPENFASVTATAAYIRNRQQFEAVQNQASGGMA